MRAPRSPEVDPGAEGADESGRWGRAGRGLDLTSSWAGAARLWRLSGEDRKAESLMTSQESGIRGSPGGDFASLVRISEPLVKPEFIELKERLTEGEEYVKGLEKLRA